MPTIDEIKTRVKTMRAAYEAQVTELVTEAVAALFESNPDVQCFGVRGYTPGFNDGDPCTHTQYATIQNEDGDMEEAPYGGDIYKFIDSLSKEFEVVYGTDFELKFFRDGRFTKDHYDCGY